MCRNNPGVDVPVVEVEDVSYEVFDQGARGFFYKAVLVSSHFS